MIPALFLTTTLAASIHPQGFSLEPWADVWKTPSPEDVVRGKDTTLRYAATTRTSKNETTLVQTGEYSWTPTGGVVEILSYVENTSDGGTQKSSAYRVPQGDGFPDSARSSRLSMDGTRVESRSIAHRIGDLELSIDAVSVSQDGDTRHWTDTSWIRRDAEGRLLASGRSLNGMRMSYDSLIWSQGAPVRWLSSGPSILNVKAEHFLVWKDGNLVKDSTTFSSRPGTSDETLVYTRVMECTWSGGRLVSCRQTNATDSIPDSVVVHRAPDGRPVELRQHLHWAAGEPAFSLLARWNNGRIASLRILDGAFETFTFDSLLYSFRDLPVTIVHAQCEVRQIEGGCPDSLVQRTAYDWNPAPISVKERSKKAAPRIRIENGRIRLELTTTKAMRVRLLDGTGKTIATSTGTRFELPAHPGLMIWELRELNGEWAGSGAIPAF